MCTGGGGGGSTEVSTPAQPAAAASAVKAANVDETAKPVLGTDTLDEARRRALGKRTQRVQLGTTTSGASSGLAVG